MKIQLSCEREREEEEKGKQQIFNQNQFPGLAR